MFLFTGLTPLSELSLTHYNNSMRLRSQGEITEPTVTDPVWCWWTESLLKCGHSAAVNGGRNRVCRSFRGSGVAIWTHVQLGPSAATDLDHLLQSDWSTSDCAPLLCFSHTRMLIWYDNDKVTISQSFSVQVLPSVWIYICEPPSVTWSCLMPAVKFYYDYC